MREAECSTSAERVMAGMGGRLVLSRPGPWENRELGQKAKDKGKAAAGGTIALNKRARHEYQLGDRYEAGLALQGWELKAIRAGRANIGEAYAVVRDGELFLFGAQVTPLIQASTHVIADERRTRKLLLHRHEIDKLVG